MFNVLSVRHMRMAIPNVWHGRLEHDSATTANSSHSQKIKNLNDPKAVGSKISFGPVNGLHSSWVKET